VKYLFFFLIILLVSIFQLSAEPFNFIYEKSFLSNQFNHGYSDPIFCVNDDGSIITVNRAITALGFAHIYRNGELDWNRLILGEDELDPSIPIKVLDVKNVFTDGYSDYFTGYYRNSALFKGSAFLFFEASSGIIQNFAYDTTYKSSEPGYNITSFLDIKYTHPTFVTNRFELFTNNSVDYYCKHYMTRYNFQGKLEKAIILDTVNYNAKPSGMNLHFKYNTILNLNFCNQSAIGIPGLKLKINYLNDNIDLLRSITIPFNDFPDDFNFKYITYIPDNDTTTLRFFATSYLQNKRMMFVEINTQTKTVKSTAFNYYKKFTCCKVLYDKDRNIILAGTCDRIPSDYVVPQEFAIFKFDTLFNLKDSLIWERGDFSMMMGFDKYQDDEFIITGYYMDKDNYYYCYTARLNSAPSGVDETKADGISIKKYEDNQLFVESPFSGLNIQIYDVLGRVFLNKQTDAQTAFVDLESIPSGVFIVSVQSGTSRKTYKIIR